MQPLAFAVLLYRAVYFRFCRGLIAILPHSLGFCACLQLLFPINSAPSIRVPFFVPYRLRLFSRPSAGLARLLPTRAFMLCLGYFYIAFGLRFRLYANLRARSHRRLLASLLSLLSGLGCLLVSLNFIPNFAAVA